jgi:5-methyltetrahydropteroyltriglutamate--homocysteine methyltransferase
MRREKFLTFTEEEKNMQHTKPPFRADHIGSLLRPPQLLAARAQYAEGHLSGEDLRRVEDQAILDILDLQRQSGINIYTDGEYRRHSWLTAMNDALDGFVPEHVQVPWQGPGGGMSRVSSQVVGGKLRQKRRLHGHESTFLRDHAPGPFKITLASVMMYVGQAYKPGVTDKSYPTRADLRVELLNIVRNEVRLLVEEGVPYIQIDDPSLTFYVDEGVREFMREQGLDMDHWVDDAIATDNACLEPAVNSPSIRALHLCRGNSQGRWLVNGGYEPIAERLFNLVQADRFLLEYDSERAGGFEPLRFVPRGKTVVLGLVSTKSTELESQDDLLRRIEEASKYVPVEHLAISPQCGFATVSVGNPLTYDDQQRKLQLVVDTAEKVWGRPL